MQARLTTKSEHEVIAAIQALDLEPVKVRLMDPELGEGWSREYADSIGAAYQTYLTMLVKYPDDAEDILLSEDVDEFWHTHILQTRKYMQDCQNVFGTYLHHEPQVGVVDFERRALQAEKTRNLYEREFGREHEKLNAAYCAASVKSEKAAYCAASVEPKDTAYCAATIGTEKAAYCAASKSDKAAYCAASVKLERVAYCAASVGAKTDAYCAASVKAEKAAYCAAGMNSQGAAYCAATLGTAAYCAASVKTEKAAYCAASVKTAPAPAYCAASIRAQNAAYCAASVEREGAYCAASVKCADSAYCAASINEPCLPESEKRANA